MKLEFEGPNFHSILLQIRGLLDAAANAKVSAELASQDTSGPEAQGPGPEGPDLFGDIMPDPAVDKPVANPVAKPVDKSKLDRIAAMNKAKAEKAAKAAAAAKPPVEEPAEEPEEPKAPKAAKAANKSTLDPVQLRTTTIADLQHAYANGHQKEVFELLSRFGNGAKSFRELPPEAFGPIRDAIDKGALA